MREATVSGGYAKAVFDFAVANGADQTKLLTLSKIQLVDLEAQDSRILMSKYQAMVGFAKQLTNDAALILRFCQSTIIAEFSIVGLICSSVPTMGDALKQLNRFSQLVAEVDVPMSGARFQMLADAQGLYLVDNRSNPNDFPELTEATFGRFICEFERYFSGQPFAKCLHVTHPKPSYYEEYNKIFNMPIVFESDKNALLVDPAWLQVEITSKSEYVFGILSQRAQNLMADLERQESIRSAVEQQIMPILHMGDTNMALVAGNMGMTRQTLYRRLKSENINFETLFDELRYKMSLHYMNSKNVSVNETAYLVGFSEPSAFSRAFKRWTGNSPSKHAS